MTDNAYFHETQTLRTTVAAVAACHWPVQPPGVNATTGEPWDPFCGGCYAEGGYDSAPTYPCRTARALGDAAAAQPETRHQ